MGRWADKIALPLPVLRLKPAPYSFGLRQGSLGSRIGELK